MSSSGIGGVLGLFIVAAGRSLPFVASASASLGTLGIRALSRCLRLRARVTKKRSSPVTVRLQ